MEDRKNTNRENLVQIDVGKGDRKASRKLEKVESLVRYIYIYIYIERSRLGLIACV